jgi:hypothetical protein
VAGNSNANLNICTVISITSKKISYKHWPPKYDLRDSKKKTADLCCKNLSWNTKIVAVVAGG